MISTFSIGVALLGASLGFSGHHVPKAGCCEVCGVPSAAEAILIDRLQHDVRWRKRDNAAHALRKFSWKCHPEVAIVLANAMLHDCEEEVREEAAESLAKLAPCLPEVHVALERAARLDPDHATRKWATRGLKAIGKHCIGECVVCLPGTPVHSYEVIPAPSTSPNFLPPVETTPPDPTVIPPTELEPIDSPIGRSPFGTPAASRDRKSDAPRRSAFLIGRIR